MHWSDCSSSVKLREGEQEQLPRCRGHRCGRTDDLLDMQSLARFRERCVMRRTAVINQILRTSWKRPRTSFSTGIFLSSNISLSISCSFIPGPHQGSAGNASLGRRVAEHLAGAWSGDKFVVRRTGRA